MRSSRYALGLICLSALFVVGLAGCSKSSTTESGATSAPAESPAAEASPAPEASTVTVNTSQGKVTAGTNVDPASLGIPVYPGAQAAPNQSGSVTAGGRTSKAIVMTTSDAFDKVVSYYDGQMSGATKSNTTVSGTKTAVFITGMGTNDQKTVTIQEKDGKVTITMTRTQT